MSVAAAPDYDLPVVRVNSSWASRARGLARCAKNLFAGAFFTQFLLLAIVALGWNLRLARRRAWRVWSINGLATAPQPERRPGWVAATDTAPDATLQSRWFGGLWENAKLGLQAALVAAAYFAPASILWVFSWRYGWDNSFQKGYEQAFYGPATGISGIVFFILALAVVPSAQARLSITRDWRSAFDLPVLLRMLWALPLRWTLLALCIALAAVTFLILRSVPAFMMNIRPDLIDATDAEVLQAVRSYWFWGASAVFPIFVWLRHRATGFYAYAVIALLRSPHAQQLHAVERALVPQGGMPPAGAWPLGKTRRRTMRAVAIPGFFVLAFAAAATIYVAQFLNDEGPRQWINYPPVQVPILNYAPAHLFELGE